MRNADQPQRVDVAKRVGGAAGTEAQHATRSDRADRRTGADPPAGAHQHAIQPELGRNPWSTAEAHADPAGRQSAGVTNRS